MIGYLPLALVLMDEGEGMCCSVAGPFHPKQACKLKFWLRELTSCSCCAHTSQAALKADGLGSSGTETGSEFAQPKFEFTGLILSPHVCGC